MEAFEFSDRPILEMDPAAAVLCVLYADALAAAQAYPLATLPAPDTPAPYSSSNL